MMKLFCALCGTLLFVAERARAVDVEYTVGDERKEPFTFIGRTCPLVFNTRTNSLKCKQNYRCRTLGKRIGIYSTDGGIKISTRWPISLNRFKDTHIICPANRNDLKGDSSYAGVKFMKSVTARNGETTVDVKVDGKTDKVKIHSWVSPATITYYVDGNEKTFELTVPICALSYDSTAEVLECGNHRCRWRGQKLGINIGHWGGSTFSFRRGTTSRLDTHTICPANRNDLKKSGKDNKGVTLLKQHTDDDDAILGTNQCSVVVAGDSNTKIVITGAQKKID